MNKRHQDAEQQLSELAAQNPVSPEAAARLLDDPVRADRIRRQAITLGSTHRRGAWRWVRWSLLPAAAVSAAAVVAAGYGEHAPVTSANFIACFAARSAQANVHVVAASAGVAPTHACRSLWQRGDMTGAPADPHLYQCTLPSGVLGVIPSGTGSPCNSLDLANVAAGGASPRVMGRFAHELGLAIADHHGCLRITTATRVAHDLIRTDGLRDWHVDVAPLLHSSATCSTFAVTDPRHAVTVVPSARGTA